MIHLVNKVRFGGPIQHQYMYLIEKTPHFLYVQFMNVRSLYCIITKNTLFLACTNICEV